MERRGIDFIVHVCFRLLLFFVLSGCAITNSYAQNKSSVQVAFENPPESAKPWVLWYWMHAAISKEGITADLESMKNTGIAGAYLVCIFDSSSKVPFPKPVRQLSPEWWGMVNHATQESKRLGLKLAMHMSDGFALAGGPWITPRQSMQKLVWSKFYATKTTGSIQLQQPQTNEGFYKDIAVFAYPLKSAIPTLGHENSVVITTSTGEDASFLTSRDKTKLSFRSDTACWIQFSYSAPFTLRALTTRTGGNNLQAQRLILQSSNDGIQFNTVLQLKPPRHGWQDTDEDYTFSIPPTTARYFRFVYNKNGTEPGAEDLDAAKWKPTLKIRGIYLSSEPLINQIETKNGSVWRVAENTSAAMVADEDAIPFKDVINLTGKMMPDGTLNWKAPSDNWVVVRIGHTSTAHKNATGGAAKGLECDKFDSEAITSQFNNWFGKAFEKTDAGLASEVLKIFYIDSWEAGSQNWSEKFAAEFKRRRGYDLIPYLLVMTGTPLDDAATSEKILHDVRETIVELVNDVFYRTLRKLADEKGCRFTAESVAPTMVSDGLLHYKTVDYPTGEFWLNSPTHDKPNDMLDAISAAHIYGKNIVQAEAFTTVRMDWSEHPGALKALGDQNFAAGINRMLLHVSAHNPFLDKKPGVTLDGVGLYFQRDQTWMKPGRAWIQYMTRTSALLQLGKPVVDIAVFIGEEVPRRSVLPERLADILPGLFGEKAMMAEKKRMENVGQPMTTVPSGVLHAKAIANPAHYVNALKGYKYDSFNPDVLLGMQVVDGNILTPGGASYKVLVIPGKRLMNPNSDLISLPVARKIVELVKAGARIILDQDFKNAIRKMDDQKELDEALGELYRPAKPYGNLYYLPFQMERLNKLGIERDLDVLEGNDTIAWAHRKLNDGELYFLSNPHAGKQKYKLSFRVDGKLPELLDAVSGTVTQPLSWQFKDGRTIVELELQPNASVFVNFQKHSVGTRFSKRAEKVKTVIAAIDKNWHLLFDKDYGGSGRYIKFERLKLWNEMEEPGAKYYSGTAIYKNEFSLSKLDGTKPVWLELDSLFNLADIKINGKECGVIWTKPYRIDISNAIKKGRNTIEIAVTNTWANRLIGDQKLPEDKRTTWTTAPFRLEGKPLLPSGLVGEVKILQ